MAATIQSPAKYEVRSVIRFLNAKVKVQRKFTNKFLLFMVTLWIGKSDEVVPWILRRKNWRLRRTKSGRPSFISYDFLQEIEGEIRSNRRVSIRELHRIIPEVSKTTIREAATEKLGYRKLCARWVPKMLADDHKTKRMGSALKFLTLYAQKGDEFLDYIATGDETWVFHHTP